MTCFGSRFLVFLAINTKQNKSQNVIILYLYRVNIRVTADARVDPTRTRAKRRTSQPHSHGQNNKSRHLKKMNHQILIIIKYHMNILEIMVCIELRSRLQQARVEMDTYANIRNQRKLIHQTRTISFDCV